MSASENTPDRLVITPAAYEIILLSAGIRYAAHQARVVADSKKPSMRTDSLYALAKALDEIPGHPEFVAAIYEWLDAQRSSNSDIDSLFKAVVQR